MFKKTVLALALCILYGTVIAAPVDDPATATAPSPAPTPNTKCISVVICPSGYDNYKVCHTDTGCSVTCVPTGTDTENNVTLPIIPSGSGRKKSVIDFLANGTFDTKAQTITFNIN